ncbi:2OG-Fe(II) oxygenase [uncultured Legionella sp.]|uniref:2OG-Fe(II) oxygenase n=1 Tax=uncultured Legionella sp. TaxID=210934 RepID=UPI00261DF91D|nr:2OG-Fe(II) oxygenase [uncultured Legionella sp.]
MLDPELISHHLCTQGFHIIDGFLDVEHYQALIARSQLMHEEGLFRSAKIGMKVQAHQNNAIRTDEICWIEEETTDASIHAFLKQTNALANILNRNLFLGLAEFETHFAVYKPGAYYKKHIDQFASKKTRKISCVYYLNEHWQEEFGGALNLYTTEDQLLQKVYPKSNRFICFNSELPHEVCLTHQTRYSITGWMKTAPPSGSFSTSTNQQLVHEN